MDTPSSPQPEAAGRLRRALREVLVALQLPWSPTRTQNATWWPV